jgi:uncharacterized membrane protein YphA (DoxX/SURF4 family)
MRIELGRHVFGLASIAFGIFGLAWHDFNIWQQIQVFGKFAHRDVLVAIASVIEIAGGIAIQWPKTARAGAVALGALYFVFAVLWLPLYAAKPLAYDRLANFFEQFSLVSGALIVYATFDSDNPARAASLARIGYIGFAICVVSFTLDQLFYLKATADFVPKWIPGQMFWAVTTTIAFALAAIALLTGHSALLASRLLTLMIAGFGLLIWLPAPFIAPHDLTAWAGNAENWAICGSAWIVADYLAHAVVLQTAGVGARSSTGAA